MRSLHVPEDRTSIAARLSQLSTTLFGPSERIADAGVRLRARWLGGLLVLMIAARAIERQGGRVWAEGEEGTGAVFRFTLGAR